MKAIVFTSVVVVLSTLCYLLHKDFIIGAASVLVAAVGTFRFLDRFDFK